MHEPPVLDPLLGPVPKVAPNARIATVTWQRLDGPGTDTMWLQPWQDGWLMQGWTTFPGPQGQVVVSYLLTSDAQGQTHWAHVCGWAGDIPVALYLSRRAGCWRINGQAHPAWDHLHHLDLGFTPATNWHQLLTMNLAVGQSAACPVLWLDAETWTLTELPQTYQRTSRHTYAYSAPTVGYSGELTLDADGFIRFYPGLWQRVDSALLTTPVRQSGGRSGSR